MIGYYSMGLFGYEILDVIYDIDNALEWRATGETKTHISKIYTTPNGRDYFRPYGRGRVYLDEVLSVG